MARRGAASLFTRLWHGLWVLVGASTLTLAFFLVLPLMQTISSPPPADLIVQRLDTVIRPPEESPPEKQPPKEPEPEERPPELVEDVQPLTLAQLELALEPGLREAWAGGDLAVKLNTVVATTKETEAIFSMSDLDQKPRVLYQPSPVVSRAMREKMPGTVCIIFVVDARGKVENPLVQKSTDPVFEKAAVSAVRQWRFEPGTRNGQAVRFRMRVPVSFR